jgi:hypothetical protein
MCLWTAPSGVLLFIPRWHTAAHTSIESRWNDNDRRKPKNSEKKLSQCYFFQQTLTWAHPSANPGLRSDRPATNRQIHGTSTPSSSPRSTLGSVRSFNQHIVFCMTRIMCLGIWWRKAWYSVSYLMWNPPKQYAAVGNELVTMPDSRRTVAYEFWVTRDILYLVYISTYTVTYSVPNCTEWFWSGSHVFCHMPSNFMSRTKQSYMSTTRDQLIFFFAEEKSSNFAKDVVQRSQGSY